MGMQKALWTSILAIYFKATLLLFYHCLSFTSWQPFLLLFHHCLSVLVGRVLWEPRPENESLPMDIESEHLGNIGGDVVHSLHPVLSQLSGMSLAHKLLHKAPSMCRSMRYSNHEWWMRRPWPLHRRLHQSKTGRMIL